MFKGKSCFGILFSMSLVVGIIFAIIISNSMKDLDLDIDRTITPTKTDDVNPEDTYLIIGVDSLAGQTHNLEGAWLATLCSEEDHASDAIHIVLITLYPILSENINNFELRKYANPHDPIQIDRNDLNSIASIPPVAMSEEPWDHVIILDEVAMNTAIHLNDINISDPIPTPSLDTFIKPWEDPARSFQQQSSIIKTLCDEPEAYGKLATIQRIIDLSESNLLVYFQGQNLSLFKLWQMVDLQPGETVECELYPEPRD
jgi:hypothetical protein